MLVGSGGRGCVVGDKAMMKASPSMCEEARGMELLTSRSGGHRCYLIICLRKPSITLTPKPSPVMLPEGNLCPNEQNTNPGQSMATSIY